MTPAWYMVLGAGIVIVIAIIVLIGLILWMEYEDDKLEDIVGPRGRSKLP